MRGSVAGPSSFLLPYNRLVGSSSPFSSSAFLTAAYPSCFIVLFLPCFSSSSFPPPLSTPPRHRLLFLLSDSDFCVRIMFSVLQQEVIFSSSVVSPFPQCLPCFHRLIVIPFDVSVALVFTTSSISSTSPSFSMITSLASFF